MNTSYILSLLIGAVICTGLFAFTLSKRRGSLAPALCAFPIGLFLGTVCSKVLYVLMKAQEQFDNYGLSAFLRTQPAEFTFVGGCVGVFWLYVWLPGFASSPLLSPWMPLPLPAH